MKKFFSMMAAVVAVFTFAACGNDEVTSSKLDTPVIKSVVATAEGDGFVVSWGAVNGASDYVVMIQGQAESYTTQKTTYTVTGLTMGTYKVMVKAVKGTVASEFSAAKSVTISGPKTVDWFTQTLALAQDNEENAAKCINSSNTILISWKGTEIDSISTALFYADDEAALAEITYDDIASQMASADEFLESVNSVEGEELMYDELSGDTLWVVFTYVTSGTKEFFTYNTIKTNPTVHTVATNAWLGTWKAISYQQYTVATTGEDGNNLPEDLLEDKVSEFELTIEPDPDYSNYVYIGGLSNVISAEQGGYALAATRLGKNGEYILGVVNGNVLVEDGGNVALWLSMCNFTKDGVTEQQLSDAGFYSMYFINDDGTFTTEMASGYYDQAKTIEYEVLFSDIFMIYSTGGLGIYGDTYRYGAIDIVSKTAEYTPSVQALNAKKFSAPASIPASMVVRF